MSNRVQRAKFEAAKSLKPPPKLSYSQWATTHFRVVSGANVGRYRPWKFQRGWLDAMGDPLLERVSIIKAAQVGYTTALTASIGADAANDPTSVILLMPTDDDARGIIVDDIDPAFREVPALAGLMRTGRFDGRNTLTQRVMLGGGSLKVLAARSPRNLRRHRARKLYCDEVDGMEITKEGDPIDLAENRTISFADRKLVSGSTPKEEATSIITRRYRESDQRIFEVPCPQCGHCFELLWDHLAWEKGKPETVYAKCPESGCVIEEKHKPAMVEAGEWRATHPEVVGHAGFRINALVSLQANASWPKHVLAYEKAVRAGPAALQPFYNTVLGLAWSNTLEAVSEHELMARRENFGLRWNNDLSKWRVDIPAEVRYITAGVDVQHDRFETTLIGWSENQRWILGHEVTRGPTNLETTWSELDWLLSLRWPHPLGGEIGVEAAGIDSGDGNRTQFVYNFVVSRSARRIFAVRGDEGPRPVIKLGAKRKKGRYSAVTPYIVGVDQVKADIITSVGAEKGTPGAFRFADCLDEEWFRQFTSERRAVEYKAGRPKVVFKRIENRAAEALDATVYGLAVRQLCRFDYAAREKALSIGPKIPRPSMKDALAKLHR
jgi:phage terminase large subunit GpA-like protein